MQVHVIGLEQLLINQMKAAGITVLLHTKLPDQEQIRGDMLMLTSRIVPLEQVQSLREQYPETTLFYHDVERGLKKTAHANAICNQLGIKYLSPRASAATILDQLSAYFSIAEERSNNVIGVFGSGQGIGMTSVAATLSRTMAQRNKKVILLGLDLYDPGWNQKPTISLDQWRPRLIGKILRSEDFEQLIKVDQFSYLPGSFDYMDAQDYEEEEIDYLIHQAQAEADIVVLDCGSIPESAAWYIGLQRSHIRLFVSHPAHRYRTKQLLSLMEHLNVDPYEFFMIVNRASMMIEMTSKDYAKDIGMPLLLELPSYAEISHQQLTLPLGKREMADLDQAVGNLLAALGLETIPQKKRGWLA